MRSRSDSHRAWCVCTVLIEVRARGRGRRRVGTRTRAGCSLVCTWRVHLSRLAQPRTNRHAHLLRARAKVRVRVGEKVEVRRV